MASPCSFCIAKGEFKLLLLHSKRMREMVQRREACPRPGRWVLQRRGPRSVGVGLLIGGKPKIVPADAALGARWFPQTLA